MTELEKILKRLEATLGKLQVSGPPCIIMGDAFRLLYQAQSLAKPAEPKPAEPKPAENKEAEKNE